MQIILNDWTDIRDLVALLDPAFLAKANNRLAERLGVPPTAPVDGPFAVGARRAAFAGMKPSDPSNDVAPTGGTTENPAPSVTEALAETGEVAVDAAGFQWDERIHSNPPKINAATGTWRARRGVSKDLVAEVEAAQMKVENDAADAAVSNAEPDPEGVATETHALPQSEPQSEPEADATQNVPRTPGPDLAALVEASQESAGDASDSMQDLLTACRDFVSSHSTTAFNALKHAVAPLEGSETGVAVQSLTPDQRRLMRACMDNYALFV